MGSKAENVSQRLRSRSRSTSRGRAGSTGSSPSRRRSKSPARSQAVSEKRAATPPRSSQGRKSLPKTPQIISPSRQSLRLVEKTLGVSVSEEAGNGRRRKQFATELHEDSDISSLDRPYRITEMTFGIEPPKRQEEPEKIQVLRPELTQPQEELGEKSSGGLLSFILIILLPALVLSVGLSCSPKSCDIRHYPSIPRNLSAYLDVEAAVVLSGWVVFQFILALIPVGGVRLGQPLWPDGKRLKYRCNGLFALVSNILIIGLLFYFEYPVYDWLSEKFLQLTVAASLFALFFSIWAFVRARGLPMRQLSYFGQSGNFFSDFYMGRELNPGIGGVNLKLFFVMNVGLIGWATLASLTLVEAFQEDRWTGTLLLVAGLQSMYLLDAFLFQGSFVTTVTAIYEGLGFKMVFASLAWQPLVSSILVRYLLLNPKMFCNLTAVLSTLLFLTGYLIYRCSNYQKDLFRQNPHDPAFSGWNKISSRTGRPLLCTFWWSFCRHPNYLGNLLMVLAWSLPCGLDCPLSYAIPLLMMITFAGRIRAVEALCRAEHGVAWNWYTHKVTSRLIPWIY